MGKPCDSNLDKVTNELCNQQRRPLIFICLPTRTRAIGPSNHKIFFLLCLDSELQSLASFRGLSARGGCKIEKGVAGGLEVTVVEAACIQMKLYIQLFHAQKIAFLIFLLTRFVDSLRQRPDAKLMKVWGVFSQNFQSDRPHNHSLLRALPFYFIFQI